MELKDLVVMDLMVMDLVDGLGGDGHDDRLRARIFLDVLF
jgi:hypothetical protein